MAHAVTALDHWSAEATSVDAVLAALSDLRRHAERRATRTAVMTLVVIGTDTDAVERAVAGVHELGPKHPARTIVLHADADADGGRIDARVELEGVAEDGQRVVSEDVHIRVAGPAARHLDSLIEPFTLPDLPVVVWFVDALPNAADPVLATADDVIVDSREFGGLEAFAAVHQICAAKPVTDLSWVRLQPWRSALRSAFDTPALAPLARHTDEATVTGKTGPRHLIAGWLASRLDLALADIHLSEAEHVSIRVRADDGHRRGSAAVLRDSQERTLRVEGSVDGVCSFSGSQHLPPAGPGWGLAEALSRLDHDPVYEAALVTALDF